MSNALSNRITLPFLIKFTLPSVIVMLFTALYTIVDGFFVSNFVNTDALSAVNIVYPVVNVVYAVGLMFGTGLTAIVARKMGEGKREEACQVFSFVCLSAALFGLVLTIASFFSLDGPHPPSGSNDALPRLLSGLRPDPSSLLPLEHPPAGVPEHDGRRRRPGWGS